jgi:UDP-N-acetylglucosamine 2-epimerase
MSNFDKKIMNEYFQLNEFDFWSIFRPKLENILHQRLKDMIILINKVEDLLNTKKFDLAWTLDDWGDDRTIVMVCQSKKIPVCMLLTGSLAIKKPEGRSWILPSVAGERIADKLFVWGDNDKKNCIEANVDMKKISVGGAPRYDQLFLKNISADEDYILVLTGGMPSTQNSYFLSTSVILNFETLLRNTLQEVKKFNKKTIIKRHPTQGPQEVIDLQKMFSEIIPEGIVLKDANTIDLISKASLIISVQSTVIEESIILDKPIILIPYTKNDSEIPYVSSGAVIMINNTDNINKIIHSCLFDNDIKERLRQGRKIFLEKTFSYQGNAAERHYEIMKEILKDD